MSQILEYFSLPDRMVSLCIYQGAPAVIVQDDGDLRSQSFVDLKDAIEVFDMVIQEWLEQGKLESALFFQHPEISA